MPRGSPYDWKWEEGGEDTELERFRRAGRGNGAPLSRGEFYAVHEAHLMEDERRNDRIQALEDKVYAPQRLLRGLLWSGWGKAIILIGAVLTTLIVAEYHEHIHWP